MIIIWHSLKKVLGCDGIMVFPFIILGKKDYTKNKVILNHEFIHVRQALELLVIPFYLIYVIEFLIRWCTADSKFEAYRKISFEQEAYNHDVDLQYLNSRSPYSFVKYWRSSK